MADNVPNIPATRAELEKLVKEFERLKEAGNTHELEKRFDSLRDKAKELVRALQGAKEGSKIHADLAHQLELVEQAAKSAATALGGFDAFIRTQERETRQFYSDLDTLSKTLKGVGVNSDPTLSALKSLGRTLMGTGELAVLFGNQTTANLIKPLATTQDFIGTLPRAFQNYYNVMKEGATIGDTVRMSMFAYGKSLGDTEGPASVAVGSIDRISKQFGISRKEAWDFVSAMKGVPGAVAMLGRAVQGVNGPIEAHTQLMQVAKKAGMNAQDVNALATTSFERYGGKVEDVAKNIATFHAAVVGTDIPLSKAISQIQTAGEPLGIFGRKITETTNVWKTFTESLKGLPIDAVGKLFTTVTQQIANMNIGTQAFVAQMSGMVHGVSALGGALRMEMEMRQPGGIERNLERVMQTISRLGGGRVLTLEEATNNPALEMQFQLQRQMVGQMLGVQGGQEQSRVLEVLQGIQRGGISTVDASNELHNMMRDGQKAQDKSNVLLDTIAQNATLHTSLLRSLVNMESRSKEEMRKAGKAAGTVQTGRDPQVVAFNMRKAGYYTARALERIAMDFGGAARRVHGILSQSIAGFVGGFRSRRAEIAWRTQHTPDGPPIDVGHPERTARPLTMTPLPTATGMPLFPTLREQQTQRNMMMMPLFERREEFTPMLGAGVESPTAGGYRSRRAIPQPGARTEAESARDLAAPMETATVRINVVCEKCLEKKIYDVTSKNSREAKGDHY